MHWIWSRLLAALAALAGGAAVGWVVGRWIGMPAWAVLLGAALAVGVIVARDALRADRLVRWLRPEGSRDELPPGDGVWGELGYRMNRLLLQQRESVAAEQQRLAQFQSAIEASPNGVLLLDAEGGIEWCNAAAAVHFGLDPRRDSGQAVTNLVRAPAFVAYMQRRDFERPVTTMAPDGRTLLTIQARPFGESKVLVLSQDITERERADAMRRNFVANVSHEIRTPLTVLAGFVETLATLPLTEVERKRVLHLMAQQTDRMRGLVTDLLMLAQLEGSQPPPPDQWVALSGLLEQARVDASALSAGRHRISFPDVGNLEIAGSAVELQSAIGNLLGNAVRYTPEGGSIDVRWKPWAGGAQLEVADTGPGIAREHLARLPERFYRVDGSRSRETGGTGLGLSIVKHVMQRHGGTLEIESELGKGSRFMLAFPAVRLREGGALSPERRPSVATPP